VEKPVRLIKAPIMFGGDPSAPKNRGGPLPNRTGAKPVARKGRGKNLNNGVASKLKVPPREKRTFYGKDRKKHFSRKGERKKKVG